MKRTETTFIKDLELQLDYLICYAPQGWHWKKEYHFRQQLISDTLNSELTPPAVIEKINNIQESIYKLKNKDINDQPYLNYTAEDPYVKKRNVPVHDSMTGEQYFIEI